MTYWLAKPQAACLEETLVEPGAADQVDELLVRLAFGQLRGQLLHRVDGVHGRERAAEHRHGAKGFGREQLFFAAGAGLADVDGGPDAAVGQLAIEHQFHVAGALELLENQLVHAAAGVDQRGADDRQRAAFLEEPGRGEELLGDVHGLDVDAAAHGAAGVADPLVEGAGQPGDRVHQHDDVLAHLGQALAALDDELGEADVAFDVAVEAAGDHFALDRPLHVGDFLGPLVDQQDDQLDIGIIGRDAEADVLQQDGFSGARRGDDQGPLAFAQAASADP